MTSPRTRLAVVVPFLRGGGAERVVITLLDALDRDRFDLTLVLGKRVGEYVTLLPSDVAVRDLGARRVRHAIPALVRTLNDLRPDVVLSTLGYMNVAVLVIRPLLRGRPRIVVREANLPVRNVRAQPPIIRPLLLALYRVLYRRADLVIAQCDDMRDDLIRFLRCEPALVRRIYNPVDLRRIARAAEGPNPYPPGGTNLLAVGSFIDQKGFEVLLSAFALVRAKRPATRLTVLGDGPLRADLEKLSAQLGIADAVSMPGFVSNPYPWYRHADAYVLSSWWEGLPNTILEALSCETRVVATDCRSGPRELLADGAFGVLVPVGDPAALADGILRHLDEPSRADDRAATFDVRTIVKEYEAVLAR